MMSNPHRANRWKKTARHSVPASHPLRYIVMSHPLQRIIKSHPLQRTVLSHQRRCHTHCTCLP